MHFPKHSPDTHQQTDNLTTMEDFLSFTPMELAGQSILISRDLLNDGSYCFSAWETVDTTHTDRMIIDGQEYGRIGSKVPSAVYLIQDDTIRANVEEACMQLDGQRAYDCILQRFPQLQLHHERLIYLYGEIYLEPATVQNGVKMG